MVDWHTVQYLCAVVLLVSTSLTSVVAWATAPFYGRRRWTAAIWPAYGIALAAIAVGSVHFALFGVGLLAPLLSHNASQLWSMRVLGVQAHREHLSRLLSGGSRAGFLGAGALELAIRSSTGVVLIVATESGDPLAWLGYGVLSSSGPAFAAMVRLALWPPPAVRAERKVPASPSDGVEQGDAPDEGRKEGTS